MSLPAGITQLVADRANHRCEYCQMHSALQGATFHTEHIIPSSRGGSSEDDNLALACPICNLQKSDRCEAMEPHTGMCVVLFNPRIDRWRDHFVVNGYEIEGLTPVGRAAVELFQMNRPRRILIRRAEELFGLFPHTAA